MKMLSQKVAEVSYDGLITDLFPAVEVRGGVIKATGSETVLKRGTLLGRTVADGTLAVFAGSSDTVNAENIECAVYTAGCFDEDKITVKDSYKLTSADKDELRMRNIVFKNAQKM